ncbi:MAG: VPLPA-CTERM sorting domain-containing protein [Methylococcales bacterium]
MSKACLLFMLFLVMPMQLFAATVAISRNNTGKTANDFHIVTEGGKTINLKLKDIKAGDSYTFRGYKLYQPTTAVGASDIIKDAYWTFDGVEIGKGTITDTPRDNYSYDPDSQVNTIGITNTPIPAAIWLFGSGLGSLRFFSRRKKISE